MIERTRRFLRDWPDLDVTTASLASTGTTVTVADSAIYQINWPIEIDSETMIVRAKPTSTTLTVKRAAYGSTAATHVNSSSVLINPQFFAVEVLDAINYGIDLAFPYYYQETLDTSLSFLADTYEYTIPNLTSPAIVITRVVGIDLKEANDNAWRPTRAFELRRAGTPKIKFRRIYAAGTQIRVRGYGPFPHLATGDSLHSQFPYVGEYPLVEFAGSYLLESGEARRVRVDRGPLETRENANPGASMIASERIYTRFRQNLLHTAMPPLPRHVVQVV